MASGLMGFSFTYPHAVQADMQVRHDQDFESGVFGKIEGLQLGDPTETHFETGAPGSGSPSGYLVFEGRFIRPDAGLSVFNQRIAIDP